MSMGMGTSAAAYQRALLLLQQNRPRDAERELRQVLVFDPQHAMAHCMLARCLAEQDRFDEAQHHAAQAIALAPDESMVHYTMSLVLFSRNRFAEAGAAIEQAIRLDPNDADLQAMLAQVLVQEKRWKEALAVTERGLAIDPEHIGCTNLRAIALVHLGEREKAGQTIRAALSRNPDNALSHANQGWTLLHQGEHVKAMEHFREALRLDPTNDWARAGIVEALKARHFIYRIMLRYFLFMSRMSSAAQWGLIIGFWILSRIMNSYAEANPWAAPFVRPIVYVYIAFAVMTWLSPHLFNLLLRLSKFGRHALSDDQRTASNWIGITLATAITLLVGGLVLRDGDVGFIGFGLVLLALPLSGAFVCDKGWPRWIMFAVSGVLLLLLLLHLAAEKSFLALPPIIGESAFYLFVFGVLSAQVLAMILASQRVQK
jgi:Tfp pilus assembly protein PilF